MNKNIILIVLIGVLFIGCGSARKQMKHNFQVPVYHDIEESIATNGISIHGMSGEYPINYKDKQLGDGLFNHKFFDISNRITNRLSENIDRKILIKILTKGKKQDIKVVVKEGVKFFKLHNDFEVWDKLNSDIPDVVLRIMEDNSIKFIVSYHSDIFKRGRDDIEDLGLTIDDISTESTKDWSTVILRDKNDGIVKYKIMKNAVSVSQYNKRKHGNKPVTNIKFSDADDYCFTKYNGFLSPLYVYEYALRQGSIVPPRKGISQEMIAGYDDANEADITLKKDEDIVKSDMSTEDDSYSEIIIFNYKTKKYKFKRDTFISKSVTFRCSK